MLRPSLLIRLFLGFSLNSNKSAAMTGGSSFYLPFLARIKVLNCRTRLDKHALLHEQN